MQETATDRVDETSLTTRVVADALGLDIRALFARHASDCYELYSRHGNEQLVRMLKMVGYDVGFCRGEDHISMTATGQDILISWAVSVSLLSAEIIRRSALRSEACSTVIYQT